jgi:peptide/nickel transport system ATP-binding protein
VLSVVHLTVALPGNSDRELALSDVSFAILEGQVTCLVGESGSGKSIAAHTVMGLLPGNIRATGGRILLGGDNLLAFDSRRMRKLRGARMSMIFQEPMTALNPVMTCGKQIEELLVQHTQWSGTERRKRILDILERVRLPDVNRIFDAYPHQLSGGQRQRILIAMAVILKPSLLIADEPTTALDVTTQAEVLQLIRELQRENNTAVMFITHDFGVVAEMAESVVVLQKGKIVESGPVHQVLECPQHTYTKLLLDAVPDLEPRKPSVKCSARIQVRTRALKKVFDAGGFFRRRRVVTAVDGVDIEVRKGETLGIVGESGSGKSTVWRIRFRQIYCRTIDCAID